MMLSALVYVATVISASTGENIIPLQFMRIREVLLLLRQYVTGFLPPLGNHFFFVVSPISEGKVSRAWANESQAKVF